jgi:hypothetical protein
VKTTLLFRDLPYAALACFFVVGAVRLARASHGGAGLKARPAGRIAWLPWVPWALLAAGHAAVLGLPAAVVAWDTSPPRLYALEGVGIAAGLGAVVVWSVWTRRHLARRAPVHVEMADAVFLALLFLGLATGLSMAVFERWGTLWATATLAPYVRSLAAGAPDPDGVRSLPFLVQLHVFAAFAALATAPFTSGAARAIQALAALSRRRARNERPTPVAPPPLPSQPSLGESTR